MINHLLASGTSFSLVLLSDRYSYNLPVSDPSISLVVVSATPLTYFYQHTVSAIRYSYQLFTLGNSTMYLYQLLLSLTGIVIYYNYLYLYHESNFLYHIYFVFKIFETLQIFHSYWNHLPNF